MTQTANPAAQAKLAAPGAGLPLPELFVARFIFGRLRKRNSRAQLDAMFETERDRVLELARSVPAGRAAEQVLIRRKRGLEDSSRNWSVFMTVEHLNIVNVALAGIVRQLGKGEQPEGEVSTADVKPAPGVGSEVLENFEQSCRILTKAFAALPDLATSTRHAHPWFGPLDAAGWHAMSAMHTRLHRRQIEAILAKL